MIAGLEIGHSRQIEQAAQLAALFVQIDLVTTLGCDHGSFHTAHAAADHNHVLFLHCRRDRVALFIEAGRVHRAGHQITGEAAANTAVLAADAGTDVLIRTGPGLVGPVGVCQRSFAQSNSIHITFFDCLFGLLGRQNLARANHGDIRSVLDQFGILQPQTFRLIGGGIQPVEAVIAAAADQNGVCAGLLQRLGQGNAVFHIPAMLGKFFL